MFLIQLTLRMKLTGQKSYGGKKMTELELLEKIKSVKIVYVKEKNNGGETNDKYIPAKKTH